MKQRIQGVIVGVLMTSLLFGGATVFANVTRTMHVTYGVHVVANRIPLNFADDSLPFIAGGRVFLPVRGVADAFGVDVTWNPANSTVYLDRPVNIDTGWVLPPPQSSAHTPMPTPTLPHTQAPPPQDTGWGLPPHIPAPTPQHTQAPPPQDTGWALPPQIPAPTPMPTPTPPPQNTRASASFAPDTMITVDGVSFQAIVAPTVAPGVVAHMIIPRVFADFAGLSIFWNDNDGTLTLSGVHANGTPTTVFLALNSSVVLINGESYDIATISGQPTIAGQISPVVIVGRLYIPVRVIADAFGVPISISSGVVTLG